MRQALTIFITIVQMIILISCKPDPKEVLKENIDKYLTGSSEVTIDDILRGTLSLNSSEIYIENKFQFSHNLISKKIKNKNYLILDKNKKFELQEDIIFYRYDEVNKKLLTSNGSGCDIYNLEKEIQNIYSTELTNGKIKIDDILIDGDDIYYFYKRKVYHLNSQTEEKEILCEDKTFSPPYSKFKFNVSMKKYSNLIGFSTGIGGSYNISVIDTISKKCLEKDIKSASGRFSLNGKTISYISGSAGSWTIYTYDVYSEKKEKVKHFKKISDVIFTTGFIYYKTDDNFILYNISTKSFFKLPAELTPLKKVNNKFCFKFFDTYYILYEDTLFDKLSQLSNLIPDVLKEI